MSTEEKEHWVAQLRQHLGRAKALRAAANADPRMSADRMRLRGWQADRLAATYRDLLDSERYNAAARFFLTDLYGPKDFSERDHEVERILPTMSATLPASGIRTVALAIEVDALSEELDAAMVAELRRARAMAKIGEKAYAEAYRRCGKRAQRELQLKLIGEIGEALAALVRRPLIHAALRLMRGPAKLAGLAELHAFLEDGYDAFHGMGDPTEFLSAIATREETILRQLFDGAPRPFEIPGNC
ncbi:MAG: hypothetical protein BroJett006_29190 [Betaproteobacteria bacterium]|nr:MAG: hypothetical protein BroJett006_29190 [Betaproteobacteria bacterium]